MQSCRIRSFVFIGAATLAACSSTPNAEEVPETPASPTATSAPKDVPVSEPAPAVTRAAPPAAIPASTPSSGSHTYVVKKGDTLMAIARQCYGGDASKWQKIYAANRDKIPDKNRIKVGQELVIPD
jgi:nucleoid-associated protein YgaU